MKYCQECGAEIDEAVMFCPYCGITQSSIHGGDDDAAQNNTIAFNEWELADLVGSKNEAAVAVSPIAKPDILPIAEVKLSERQEIKEESEQPQNVTAENQMANTNSIDISPQVVVNTDDSFKLTTDKEIAKNDPNSFLNTALEMFEAKAEMSIKSQIELQRIIFVQNQRIIELLEELLKKRP